jgi:hypothetical protein
MDNEGSSFQPDYFIEHAPLLVEAVEKVISGKTLSP